jgi:hypothetical protein
MTSVMAPPDHPSRPPKDVNQGPTDFPLHNSLFEGPREGATIALTDP